MKVLLIDDEDDIRRVARLSLWRVGKMEVRDAAGGLEGVRRAEEDPPDVVLLDVTGLDGPSKEIARLEEMGVRGVLIKPFDPMSLPAQLLAVLGW